MFAMTQPPIVIPPAPADPVTRHLDYVDPADVSAFSAAWQARDAAQTALITQLEADPVPPVSAKKWGINLPTQAGLADRCLKEWAPVDFGRYYLQAGELPHLPTEFTTPDAVTLLESGKLDPTKIVTGQYDSQFRTFFAQLAAKGGMWCEWHEPENDKWTSAQYKAAYAHLYPLAQAAGVPIVPILMRYSFAGGGGRNPQDWIPADYDFIGVDAYVAPGSASQPGIALRDLPTLLDPVRKAAPGKKIVIGETGIGQAVTGAARVRAFHDVAAYFAAQDDVVAVAYFVGNNPDTIEWRANADERAAWQAGAHGV